MSFQAKWTDWLNNERYSWIGIAKQEICKNFSHPFAKELVLSNTGKHVNIAVYGKTQSGKTTLILELMGIKASKRVELENLLRCGSEKGTPATPTAFIYRKVDGDRFEITRGSLKNHHKEEVDYQDALNILTQLRKDVETKVIDHPLEHMIGIPREYFDETDLNLNIIDLPGIDSSNLNEIEHTKKLIKDFLPPSNLVLILCAGNQMASLNDLFKDNEINRLANWEHFPQKYRIVFSHSYSAQSVSKMFLTKVIEDPDHLKAYYRQQVIQSKGKNFGEIPIYPLEYSDSWNELCVDLEYKACIDKIIAVRSFLFSSLKEDISKSSSELNQLSILYGVKHALVRKRDEFKSKIQTQEDEKTVLKEDYIRDIDKIKFLIDESKNRANEIIKAKNNFINIRLTLNKDIIATDYNNYNKAYMILLINNVKQEIKTNIEDYCNTLIKELDILKVNRVLVDSIVYSTALDQIISNLKQKTSSKVSSLFANTIKSIDELDTLYISLTKKRKSSHRNLNDGIEKLIKYFDNFNNSVTTPMFEEVFQTTLDKQIANCRSEINHYEESKVIRQTEYASTIDSNKKNLCIYKESITQINHDLQESAKINDAIIRVANETMKRYLNDAVQKRGSQVLLNRLYAHQVAIDLRAVDQI